MSYRLRIMWYSIIAKLFGINQIFVQFSNNCAVVWFLCVISDKIMPIIGESLHYSNTVYTVHTVLRNTAYTVWFRHFNWICKLSCMRKDETVASKVVFGDKNIIAILVIVAVLSNSV